MIIFKFRVLVAALACTDIGWAAAYDTCSCRNVFPTADSLQSITYGNGQFVAVGRGGTILTSVDGTAWACRQSPTQDDFSAVAFGNGLFVAVSPACGANACNGTIITSVDGINWVLRPHGATVWGLNAVTFGN